MSFEADEEILQDFLIEAGELLETLNGQLVELELLESISHVAVGEVLKKTNSSPGG